MLQHASTIFYAVYSIFTFNSVFYFDTVMVWKFQIYINHQMTLIKCTSNKLAP